jgi:anaerobic magnesium-protoporphyrin IX monomethyl ester cyclase
MRILLMDIVRTSLEEVWPSVEHSLGLMYLSSALKQKFGGMIHMQISTLISNPGKTEEERTKALTILDEFRPNLVGIRCLSIGKDSLHRLVDTVREWNRNCFLVVGGPHATDNPEDVLRSGKVDCVVIGEGEVTATELIKKLFDNEPIGEIPGIAYMRRGTLIRTAVREAITDLDSVPMPDYSLIDLDAFANQYLTFTSKIYKRHANILTTRGCPFKCMYCHNILGKRFRARSPESVLSELRFLHDEYGLTDFQVIDDIFNFNRARAIGICDLIIESGMKLTISFPNGVRGDMMDEELIDKLAAAGTRFMSYAIETASPRLQRLIHKNVNLEKLFRAIEYTANVGIITRGFFMLGFPTETEEEAIQTIEYAKAASLCGATFFTVVYFPGTELYKLAQSLGYFQEKGYEVRRDYVQPADGPYEFTLERLVSLKRKAIREFAFTGERIKNALGLLPAYFSKREIDGFFMSYVVSSGLSLDEVQDEIARELLRKYFLIAERFSKGTEFYV